MRIGRSIRARTRTLSDAGTGVGVELVLILILGLPKAGQEIRGCLHFRQTSTGNGRNWPIFDNYGYELATDAFYQIQ